LTRADRDPTEQRAVGDHWRFQQWPEIYRLHRDRVIQEDNLINNRMTWMLYSQTILFALWGGVFASELQFLGKGHQYDLMIALLKIFQAMLAICAIIAAVGSWVTLTAAIGEIERIKTLYEAAKAKYGYTLDPSREIFGMVTGAAVHHRWGHILTKWGPWFFVGVWCVLLVIFVGRSWLIGEPFGAAT
jgi:hypothetical protein